MPNTPSAIASGLIVRSAVALMTDSRMDPNGNPFGTSRAICASTAASSRLPPTSWIPLTA